MACFELDRGKDVADFDERIVLTLLFRREAAGASLCSQVLHTLSHNLILPQLRHCLRCVQIETAAQ